MRKLEILKELASTITGYFKQLGRDRKIHQSASNFNTFELHQTILEKAAPCFVLSTGRCGTQLLDNLLNTHSSLLSYHNPTPELTYHCNYAYQHANDAPGELRQMIDVSRYEYIRDAYLCDKRFVETNNRISFFCYALADLYPKARFIHLIRHPIPYIKSGMSRSWYSGKVIYDESRIKPPTDSDIDWQSLSRTKKIAWLWNETNQFIEDFKKSLETNRHITVKSEELFNDISASRKIFRFLELSPISTKSIRKQISRPVNKGRKSSRDEIHKEEIQAFVPLMNKYY